ncbi:hypothetical protein EB796_021458 [Bugula neritina]|uniref:Annexin n=1 Tax=Bugula neritina TaxID=10212 RepID=A0A7J7J324_BUGNE|nr:hypothetical protein EB796_021458 [Bugula neritina]
MLLHVLLSAGSISVNFYKELWYQLVLDPDLTVARLFPPAVAVGDKVLLPEYGGTKVNLNDEEYTLVRDDDILGVFDNTSQRKMSFPYPSGYAPTPGGYAPTPGGYAPAPGGYAPAPGYPPSGGMPQPAPAPPGLPYAAQPYPSAANYPPGNAFPGQGGMPMPDQSSGYPSAYPAYPSGGGAPYPPGDNSSYPPGANPPYSQGGMPYPSGANTSYPPGGGTPYPTGDFNPSAPAGSTAYPPQIGGSNTVAGGSPYPASGSTQNSGSPYPASSSAPYPTSNQPGSSTMSSGYPTAASSSTKGSTPSVKPQPTNSSATSAYSSQLKDGNLTSYYECAKKPGDSGLVKPLTSGFDPEADATQLKNCLKSSFLNETVIVNILPHRSNAQRQKIRLMYKTMYGKDLLQDLRDRLTGDFESVTVGLLMKPAEYDAYLIHRAIQGLGTDEDVLVEILCTRTNAQIQELGHQYRELYKATIEQHMQGDTSGHFMRMLISLSNGARQEDQGVNAQKAEDDAKKLYKAGAARLGTDESTFNSVFVSQSFEQLRAVFAAYQRLYKKDMEKVIKSEMSGDLEKGMKAIVRFTLDKHSYFANVLYKAMKGLGTDEKSLIRTLVSRSEIDLEQINRSFSNIKGESKPLSHWIKKETSGPFRDMLIHIIGGGH